MSVTSGNVLHCSRCHATFFEASKAGKWFKRVNPVGEEGIWRCMPECPTPMELQQARNELAQERPQ